MRLLLSIPTHALAPALDSEGMKSSAQFFVLFPAKISYAGGQGVEDPLVHALPLAVTLNFRPAGRTGVSASLICWCFVAPFNDLSVMLSAAKYLSIIYVGKVETLNQVQGDVEIMGYDQLVGVRGGYQ